MEPSATIPPMQLQVYSYGLDVQQVQRTIKKLRQRDSVELISHLPVRTPIRRGPLLDAPAWIHAEHHQHLLACCSWLHQHVMALVTASCC